jgi:hypothetical protein
MDEGIGGFNLAEEETERLKLVIPPITYTYTDIADRLGGIVLLPVGGV